MIEQYLIKWKALSYIHCEWKDAAELALDSHNTRMKVRRCVRPSLQPAENSLTIAPSMARMRSEPRGFGHIGSALTPNGERTVRQVRRQVGAASSAAGRRGLRVLQPRLLRGRPHLRVGRDDQRGGPAGLSLARTVAAVAALAWHGPPPRPITFAATQAVQYLVKWRSLPYSEATWEYADDIKDDEQIERSRSLKLGALRGVRFGWRARSSSMRSHSAAVLCWRLPQLSMLPCSRRPRRSLFAVAPTECSLVQRPSRLPVPRRTACSPVGAGSGASTRCLPRAHGGRGQGLRHRHGASMPSRPCTRTTTSCGRISWTG